MRKYKVALARFPGSGSERMESVAWIIRTLRKMDADNRISSVHSITIADTPITMSRNRAVREAKDAGCDYLLMIDSDMSPDLPIPGARPFWDTAWGFMMTLRDEEDAANDDNERSEGGWTEPPQPATIAAPYGGPPPDECVYVFHWASRESGCPDPNFRLEMVPRELAAVKSGIEEVAALPTGLILYDMRVFEVLPPPWFCYEYEDALQTHKATTEDVFQTRNASLLGLPQFCAWDCWAGHVKTKVVGKPHIIHRDEVHSSLATAVLRRIDCGDRLIDLSAHAGRPHREPQRPGDCDDDWTANDPNDYEYERK